MFTTYVYQSICRSSRHGSIMFCSVGIPTRRFEHHLRRLTQRPRPIQHGRSLTERLLTLFGDEKRLMYGPDTEQAESQCVDGDVSTTRCGKAQRKVRS